MDLSRQEYPALLHGLQPTQAVSVLDERVKSIAKVNSEIADYLAERRKVEELYASGLRKLAGRRLQDAYPELGIFQAPWQTIVSSTETLAQSHALLAQRIETDVERPLRDYNSKSREMQGMSTIQGNLASIARDVETARKRADKIQSGKTSQNKIDNATSDYNAANQQWDTQAPYVFEQLQALDENRVNHLRDVLTQFQTHEVDQVERNRVSAENCLNAILNVNTSEEISTFVAKTSEAPPADVTPPRPKSRSSSSQILSARARTGSVDDRASAVSRAPGVSRDQTVPPVPPIPSLQGGDSPRRPGGFGLKRLGTVIGRRKDKKPDRPPSPEKRSRYGLNPLRRGASSKNMQEIPSPPETPTVDLPTATPGQEASNQETRRSETAATPSSQPTHTSIEQRRLNDERNGDTIMPTPKRTSSLPKVNGLQSHSDTTSSQDVPHTPPQLTSLNQAETHKDNDGFNVPPSAIDDISRAQQEAAASNENEAPQFKLDIRDEPIQEEGDAQSALSNVANTLRAQAQQVATPRKPTTNRGRRDVRNTMFIPTPQPPEVPNSGESPVAPLSKSTTLSTEAPQGSDAQSIRSSHSLSSLMPVGMKHPELTQPGLNASIVETVSATFTEGRVTRAVVIGELALAYNANDRSSASGAENIRLENFPVLEKVAPNPSFITQAPSRSGEYTVNVSQISRTTVAFKYQVHLDEASLGSHAPVTPTSNWKVEPTQTSVMLQYGFNSSFASPTGRSVTIKNVMVLISIEGSKTASCMSKPVGTFYRDKAMMVWKLGDVTLDGYASAPQKLLARFSTESEAAPGIVEIRWEIIGENAAGLGSGLSISRHARDEGGSDPFADESTGSAMTATWRDVPLTRKIISGKYIATGAS